MQCIQRNELEVLPQLQSLFKPLILSWLKKIHQLNTSETEDYISMAKIILLECAKKYEPSKNVPFQSFYKISLYHWYGNQMQKRKFEVISMNEQITGNIEPNFIEDMEQNHKKLLLIKHMKVLNKQEQLILKQLLKGMTEAEVGKQMNLSKKTILNKKYLIIKKLKTAVREYNY